MKYFTIAELCQSDKAEQLKIKNIPTDNAIDNLSALVKYVLDPVREHYGKPIRVNSGYRCPELNKAIGGAPTSQHTLGEAADITGGSKEENVKIYNLIKENCEFDQLIDEYDFSWIHVSFRYGWNRQQELKIWKSS